MVIGAGSFNVNKGTVVDGARPLGISHVVACCNSDFVKF
jgi:hypothetical protein